MLKKIIFYLCIGCLLTLQTACTVDENQVTETLDTSVISNYKVNLLTNGYQAELSLVNSTVDLVDEIRSSIVLSHPFEDPYNYEHMGYEIVSHSYSFQNSSSLPKGSNNNDIDAVARVPGTWDIRAWIQYPNNITVYSNVVTLTVNFRPISELSAHYNIQTEMDNLWQATKDAASSSGMNEKGFFIYVNTQNVNSYHSLVYQIVTVKNGPTVVCGETASIIPGTTSEVYPQNFMDGGIFAVAIFHTHPPLTYCSGLFGRDTGPSSEDLNYSNNNHIPGLLIDYDGQEIVMGHYINLPFKVYTYGPLRRTFY